jgi:hypothetical protein
MSGTALVNAPEINARGSLPLNTPPSAPSLYRILTFVMRKIKTERVSDEEYVTPLKAYSPLLQRSLLQKALPSPLPGLQTKIGPSNKCGRRGLAGKTSVNAWAEPLILAVFGSPDFKPKPQPKVGTNT